MGRAQGRRFRRALKPEDLIKVPENAQYFAALGAVEFGKDEEPEVGIYMGTECLEDYITVGRQAEKAKSGAAGLSASDEELAEFKEKYTHPEVQGLEISRRARRSAGSSALDGGSTSTKAVLLSEDGDVMCKAYQLSGGNPIQDTIDMFVALRAAGRVAGMRRSKSWAWAPPATPRTF